MLILNDAQRQAATTFDGPVLCVAGAGTGKTATLTARVANMIRAGIRPESILLLTFTRKAAQEMLRRAALLVGDKSGDVRGGTFHAFAHGLLRRHGDQVGLGDGFTIIDQEDLDLMIKAQVEELGFAGKTSDLPAAPTMRAMFGKAVNWSMALAEVVRKDYAEYASCLPQLTQVRSAVDYYKLWHRLVDFDDLLVFAQRLLESHQSIRETLSERHRYIMVDEYQDTNAMQARIVRLLASAHDNVMAVGDDAQSIYAFRGANVRNILEFPAQFPGAKIIPLEENFRSAQPILNATNAVIAQAKDSFRKTLYSRRALGALPEMVYCEDEHAQSEYVAESMLALHAGGVAFADMAVLFRSSFHAFDLELELHAVGIPFVKVGGLRYLESRHVKDVVSFLRVLCNPSDALAWMRILTMLPGVGAKTAQRMIAGALAADDAYRYFAALPQKGKYQADAQRLGVMLREARLCPPAAQIDRVMAYYLPTLREWADDEKDYLRRRQDIEQLGVMAARYASLEALLSELALDPPNEQSEQAASDRATLSTIHSAKGLEWKDVFVLWLTEGRFPSLYAYEDDDRLAEELRLLYVAMTRAKDDVRLCVPTYYDARVVAACEYSEVGLS